MTDRFAPNASRYFSLRASIWWAASQRSCSPGANDSSHSALAGICPLP
ncbi:Uncharacterised protein [Mycobacteroides abscessus]|nr:Uncharacterised protein [Mycobacteroides abscessus]